MARDGKPTRDKILLESKALIFKHGFSGTSIDQILEKTGITKGAFFYHFKTKNALAMALIEEFAKEDTARLNDALERTESFKGNSLNRLLEYIQVFIDAETGQNEPPGCLYASYLYEPQQFEPEVLDRILESIVLWRTTIAKLIQEVLKDYKTKTDIDVQSLADHVTVVFEGAFVVARAMNDPDITVRHLHHLKNYLELLFEKK
ncbi:TetR family transcriptional regulator [Ulvibacter sp. MAR_2010_11]|uniref:TetR/AcrR family transcriptional regulator n=1 Tax=Ulvibacter sp. MAR_2010_11 TaxID=1250229 RepID=UPI000C2CB9A9|nr:TetR/AcrR family transcriptional regulator [Ulvibacter sp. MAR_2010_11]PKA84017.1 TetR family transcriptional regulator [Ulvibacter sp. MAR_2010_11]